jgi:NifU-like protein
VMVTEKGGMTLEEAERMTPKQIMDRLMGLPTKKIHCSVLGDQALKSAIADFKNKKSQLKN